MSSVLQFLLTDFNFFFRNGGAPSDAYGFYLYLIQQGFVKIIHHKIRSHHSTPRNPIMGEVTCCQASETNAPPAKNRGHP
jgi:hypothetical protein